MKKLISIFSYKIITYKYLHFSIELHRDFYMPKQAQINIDVNL